MFLDEMAAGTSGLTEGRERVRTMRMQRHLFVAVLALIGLAVGGPIFSTVLGLVALALLIGVFLNSLARAADARLGYWWGWLYGEPRQSTRFDCGIERLVRRYASIAVRRPVLGSRSVGPFESEPRVRIVPIEPGDQQPSDRHRNGG